ncbi:Nn.00g073060.m01.CDS01 [Neocucurbitaria sp. VM-36]
MLAQKYSQDANVKHDVQHHNASIGRHHLSNFVATMLINVFAPTAYLQCSSSSSTTHDAGIDDRKCTMIVDDDYAYIEEEEEQDGGPLCREATIASWKAKTEACQQERRRSIQWFGMCDQEGVCGAS